MRKIFNRDNVNESKCVKSLTSKKELYENTISAAGVLFYRHHPETKQLQLLLISYSDPKWPRLDDMGGCVDESDSSYMETIVRETREETNGVIELDPVDMFFAYPAVHQFYHHFSKYYHLAMKVDDATFFPDTAVFGTKENTDQIDRTIAWIDYSVAKPKLAYRLLKDEMFLHFLDSQ
jgi:8-oxo-dGTP pyrophosphatase MutT (NUDIX family)